MSDSVLNTVLAEPENEVYDGGGANNALTANQSAGALIANAEIIDVGAHNILELDVTNVTADETVTLTIREYSGATPTLANMIRAFEVDLGADLSGDVDAQLVDLATATHNAKQPVRVRVTPHTYVVIGIVEDITGPCYARRSLQVQL